jgi:uncharacterized membrane protein YdjX (TVP38/TMEM64 family)
MTVLYIIGAVLWAFVLFAVLRYLAERRRARRAWLAQRAEAERLWWQRENERYAMLREMQRVMLLRKLKGLTK